MFTVTQHQKQLIKSIAKKYDIDLFVLFGSRAVGRAHAQSDFDVAYRSRAPLLLDREASMILDLSAVFGSEDIDLVNLTAAPPLLYYAIFKEGISLYEKELLAFASYAAYAFKQYVEAKPLFRDQLRYLKRNLTQE